LIPSPYSKGGCVNRKIQDFQKGDQVYSVNEVGNTVESEVIALHDHGYLEGFEVTFDDGYSVICSINHKFLTADGQKSLQEILETNSLVLCAEPIAKEDKNAQDQKRWLEESMRTRLAQQAGMLRSQQVLLEVSGDDVHDRFLAGSLRAEVQDQRIGQEAPTHLRGMPKFGVENRGGGRAGHSGGARSTLRSGTPNLSAVGGTPEGMFHLRGDQAGEYQGQKPQDQSIRWSSGKSISNSENYVSTSRNSGGEGRESQEVERGQSRGICQMHGSSDEESQAFQDGNLASLATGLGDVSNSLRSLAKTSGLRERQDLDRSGRILSFLREPIEKPSTNTGGSAGSGCDVERGMSETRERYASSRA
jgi:hypothetical protein